MENPFTRRALVAASYSKMSPVHGAVSNELTSLAQRLGQALGDKSSNLTVPTWDVVVE